ncbi:VOC family protein [Nocardioides marinquilinus]|uniref:VOC family protein n=1 Tax=Nocardioides marinquilinus TaxID=1210400 RepID=A0ABP9Q4Y9_9ACTN
MACELVAITFDVDDPVGVARFWAALLGREVVDDALGLRVLGTAAQVGLGFERATTPRGEAPELVHLHLTSDGVGQDTTVARVLDLGGRHLDVGQRPEEGHVVLADPAGDALCVLEEGNRFTAGCGPLGEVACDGLREVGVFWSEALGWPLVWDDDGETAVQSPHGGTKIAWGGPPVAPRAGRGRQRFTLLAVGDHGAEADRLVSLGATRSADGGLADPAGDELVLLSPV